jgi:delta24-sterol reductase
VQHSLSPSLFFRLLFGWALSSKNLYSLWHRVPNQIAENLFLIHDLYTPVTQAECALSRFMALTEIFPIWLCPIKGTPTPQFLSPHFGNSNFLNIGLYGIPRTDLSLPQLSAQLERELLTYGGKKMLYSFTYYDRESFANIYSEIKYTALRKAFFAENAFPTLYNKVVKQSDFSCGT